MQEPAIVIRCPICSSMKGTERVLLQDGIDPTDRCLECGFEGDPESFEWLCLKAWCDCGYSTLAYYRPERRSHFGLVVELVQAEHSVDSPDCQLEVRLGYEDDYMI